MSLELILTICSAVLLIIIVVYIMIKKLPKRIKSAHYVKKWREIQKLCSVKSEWLHAIVHADILLDEVLKKKRFTGKTMGERLVKAEKVFSANDALWSAHKLANNLRGDENKKLTENDVKNSLVAFRQALRDLGAL